MHYEFNGKCVNLRPVTLDDASFIVSLRNKERNALHINKTSSSITKQIEWMKDELKDKSSYYFIILNKKETPIGTISLYNIKNSFSEFGRWICEGSSLESLESALIIHEFAFNKLLMKKVYTRTLADNYKVVNFHRKFGAKVSKLPYLDPEHNKEFYKGEVNINMFPEIKNRCKKILEVFFE